MHATQTRLGLLATAAAIVALGGLDLLASRPHLAGSGLMLVAVAAIPVAVLAAVCLVPDRL